MGLEEGLAGGQVVDLVEVSWREVLRWMMGDGKRLKEVHHLEDLHATVTRLSDQIKN